MKLVSLVGKKDAAISNCSLKFAVNHCSDFSQMVLPIRDYVLNDSSHDVLIVSKTRGVSVCSSYGLFYL